MTPTNVVNGERLFEAQYRGIRWLTERGFVPKVLPLAFPAPEVAPGGFRFLDGQGQVWAVRSDFTPLLVRALARELEHGSEPVNVCYAGEVARPAQARLWGVAEFFQLGFESFRVEERAIEAVGLLLQLAQHLGVPGERMVLGVGQAGTAEAVLSQLLEDVPDAELLELVVAKDVASVSQRLGLSGDAKEFMRQALWGEEGGWVRYFGQEKVWEKYCQLRAVAGSLGVAARFELAPKLAGNYYNGVFFTLRGRSTRELLATGGEYQVPLRTGFVPALGSTLSLNRMLQEVACSQ